MTNSDDDSSGFGDSCTVELSEDCGPKGRTFGLDFYTKWKAKKTRRQTASSQDRFIHYDGDQVDIYPTVINEGQPNRVTTTRFNVFTWLPKSLYEQFGQLCNWYFLTVCVLMYFPWSPVSPGNTTAFFVLILILGALKALFEDRQRAADDTTINESVCLVYNSFLEEFRMVRWVDLKVGNLVVIFSGQAFPADVFLLYAPTNTPVFISTANLDGETNWKIRQEPVGLAAVLRGSAQRQFEQNGIWENERTPVLFDNWLLTETGNRRASNVSPVNRKLSVVDSTIAPPEADMIGTVLTMCCDALVTLKPPTASLWDATGTVTVIDRRGGHSEIPLTGNGMLPRGTMLQGAPWVLGVCGYVGEETKSKLNASQSARKIPVFQQDFNGCVTGEIFFLVIVITYLTLMAWLCKYESEKPKAHYFLQWFIYLYTVIPLGLYVTIEIVTFCLATLLNKDTSLGVPPFNAKARNSALIADIGQVSHIFSDKTGTLTENEMELARVSIPGGRDMGEFRLEKDSDLLPSGVFEARNILWDATKDVSKEEKEGTKMVFLCMAMCHSLQARMNEQNEPEYSGPSPEESTMAYSADRVGISLVRRTMDCVGGGVMYIATGAHSEPSKWRIVTSIAFTSDRKRMSIILQNEENLNTIWCITKGADSVIQKMLKTPMTKIETDRINEYACEGLRTLAIAARYLEFDFLESWETRHKKILADQTTSYTTKKAALDLLAAEVECDLDFVGTVAIEDRLQEGVPNAVSLILEMRCSFWMLTGDKTETAISIARNCGALTNTMELYTLTQEFIENQFPQQGAELSHEIITWMRTIINKLSDYDADSTSSGCDSEAVSLVIDGTVWGILCSTDAGVETFIDLAHHCQAFVCARLSPKQKKLLVESVRESNPSAVTLAIGDGANDVPMISAAHVGFGIYGKEGMQAVQSSDFALLQFRYMPQILLFHGRHNYRRIAVLVNYYLYKHVLVLVGIPWRAHHVKFLPIHAKIHPDWIPYLYCMVSTLPIFLYALFDKDVPDEKALEQPEIYEEGSQCQYSGRGNFYRWQFRALVHGTVLWVLPYYIVCGLEDCTFDNDAYWLVCLVAYCGAGMAICWEAITVTHTQNMYAFFMIGIIITLAGHFGPLFFYNVIGMNKVMKNPWRDALIGGLFGYRAEDLHLKNMPTILTPVILGVPIAIIIGNWFFWQAYWIARRKTAELSGNEVRVFELGCFQF